MPVTLTSNYRDALNSTTLEKIDELLDENYALDDMLKFIDEYNERGFVEHYEEYVRCGEAIGYEAVDALASELGINYITDCDEHYQGFYHNTAEFAEQWYVEVNNVYIPEDVVVDWEATWECSLRYDFTECNDGSTYRPIHIFSNN